MNTKSFVAVFILSIILLSQLLFAEIQPLSVNEIDDKATYTVLENGDVKVEEIITLSASAYQQFKSKYPTLDMFTRWFKPKNTPTQIEDLQININEINRKINATYSIKGWAINKGEYWNVVAGEEGEKIILSAQTGNTLVFTFSTQNGDFKQITTSSVHFPQDAKNIKFDSTTNKIRYELAYNSGGIWNLLFIGLGVVFLGAAAVNQFYLKY